MKSYSHYGYNDFVICAGYKSYLIKEYFHNYWLHSCDATFDMRTHEAEIHQDANDPWRVTVVDTGAETMTGGRVKRIQPYVDGEPFLLTYGDGVADVDIGALVDFHRASGRAATLTAVQPTGRFGALAISEADGVERFAEKPLGDGDWINGGFFVMEPSVFARIEGDATILERGPLEALAAGGQLGAFRHRGFWQPMDTLRDKRYLEELWDAGKAPWKVW
jgi:glucose-1-phosphate cytidylyltransferase